MIGILAKIGIGAAIFIVMLFFILLTTRDVQTVKGCDGSVKSANEVRMYIRSVTFLIAEVDAYLIIMKDMPMLKTIGISLFAYPLAIIIMMLISNKSSDEGYKGDDRVMGLFMLVLLALSIFSVYFMTQLGWI